MLMRPSFLAGWVGDGDHMHVSTAALPEDMEAPKPDAPKPEVSEIGCGSGEGAGVGAAQILKPASVTAELDDQVTVSPSAICTPSGPVVPEYSWPPTVTLS